MMLRRPVCAALGALWVAAAAPGSARAQGMPASLLGAWRVDRVVATSATPCWDAERAGTLVGSTLRYRPGSLVWKGGEVPVTEALSRTLSARQFHAEYHLEPGALGIHTAAVVEVDLQHEDADVTGSTTEVPGDTVLLLGPGRIVVSACGVYFVAVRAGR